MAKGLRASSRKKNNAALRDRLFGPASNARTERLSAKLQELAAKPRPDQEQKMNIDTGEANQQQSATDSKDEDMDIDFQPSQTGSTKRRTKKPSSGRVQKKVTKRKSKASVVFPDIKAKWRRQAEQKRRKGR